MTRRFFVQLAGAAAAAFVIDPERVLWRPGAKTLILPPVGGWRSSAWPIPPGHRLELLPDAIYEQQAELLRWMLRENAQQVQHLLITTGDYLGLVELRVQRDAIRQMLVAAHDLRQIRYVLVPEGPK